MRESLAADVATALPDGGAVMMAFAEEFQRADEHEQARLVQWTRSSGNVLLLVPPFIVGPCERPVPWRAERLERAPHGGEGLARLLAGEVTHRLEGRLQALPVAGATWSDLSVCTAAYRAHSAAGLFAVTCLPIWSLAVLDEPEEAQRWLATVAELAGEPTPKVSVEQPPLVPDHYGLLVFLLSRIFDDGEQALAALQASPIFQIEPDHARALLLELRARGLVDGARPTSEAGELVMQSPYAPYLRALREVTTP